MRPDPRASWLAPPQLCQMLLTMTDRGLYCAAGDFHIDPWSPVPRAVVTHAHSDHARWGCDAYLGTHDARHVLRTRLGDQASIRTVQYGEHVGINGVRVSLHPAGHIIGSAQVRVEYRGEVWVVTGDYKTEPDPTCAPFELVPCHVFITESTFGLPVYRWAPQQQVFEEIAEWWRGNAAQGRASVLLGYALGKTQRLLAGLMGLESGPIYTHGAVERLNEDYRSSGVALPHTQHAGAMPRGTDFGSALIVAPPSVTGGTWLRRFGDVSTAFASGWMAVRGTRRRRGVDRGFVLSDHVDWPALLDTIDGTGASQVWVTHGFREPVVRYLCERGVDARAVASRWEGEPEDSADADVASGTNAGADESPADAP